jgi:hypothetical protein
MAIKKVTAKNNTSCKDCSLHRSNDKQVCTRKCIIRILYKTLFVDIIRLYNMKEVAYMVESDNAATRNSSASSSNNNCRGPSLVEQSKS